MKIKNCGWFTILTIGMGCLVSMYMLFYSGQLATCGHEIINMNNNSERIFLFAMCLIWMVAYLIYKSCVLEAKINTIDMYAVENKMLQEDIRAMLDYIIQKSDVDIYDIQHFNKNTRELFLKLFFEKYGGKEYDVNMDDREQPSK